MKQGPPTFANPPAPVRTISAHVIPTGPRANRQDLTRVEPSYDIQREEMDRDRRRADPQLQDGSYGFDNREEKMDVDMDDGENDQVSSQRGGRYDSGRGRDGGRRRNDRGLYSDQISQRRGRGFQ